MWSNAVGRSVGLLPGRNFAGPLLLMLVCPTLALALYHAVTRSDGSLGVFWFEARDRGPAAMLLRLWTDFRSPFVWKMIGVYVGFQLLLMRLVPGGRMTGPVTPAGNTPVYKTNGLQCYALSLAAYLAGVHWGFFSGGVIVDHMGQILASMNLVALILCLMLYFKGLYFPSSTDCGSSSSCVFDYYWGTELHPTVLGWNVKQALICRLSMTFWALCVLSCALKQRELFGSVADSMLVNASLQLVYVTKFFVWESGYLRTVDVCHDRAGFYLCWGVLVWLPSVHTSHSAYLVENAVHLGWLKSALLLVVGLGSILINYDCDRQRQRFREAQGRCKIWGRDPLFIEARYRTEQQQGDSATRTNLLLASGWWGLSRHFHYVPELAASLCWTLPVGGREWLPYFYVAYLLVLVVDRAYRDDARCRSKYGKYWDQYCYHVPYKIIPGVW